MPPTKRTRPASAVADELTDSLDFLIRDTRLRLYHFIERRIARQGIPLRLWFPLRALYQHEGITQRELGKMLGFGDARAGVIVALMQRKKLVRRAPSQSDKRRIDLYLTPLGRTMTQQTLRELRAVAAQITGGFSAAEVRVFHELLLRAHENLTPATRHERGR
jgi:MarR family transcriptional regulator, organic hydroperoxide resistance regulator